MAAKKSKLEIQTANNTTEGIFKDVAIFVNGYTGTSLGNFNTAQ